VAKAVFPLAKVYTLLEPGPVVLLTTVRNGIPNVMTMSWHTMLDFEPPILACVVSDRNYSFASLQSIKECVINIPTVELAKKVVGCGNTSGRTVDKFAEFNLTTRKASTVEPPLINECYASFECRVVDTSMVKKYDLFVLEVLKAWVDRSKKNPRTIHHRGMGEFMVAGRKIKLKSKMK
jgi:flavin reductase (DIM6/NTAB) family NADH-FMN oxidoreductase RutF